MSSRVMLFILLFVSIFGVISFFVDKLNDDTVQEVIPNIQNKWQEVAPQKNLNMKVWKGEVMINFVDYHTLQRIFRMAYPKENYIVSGFAITDKETGVCVIWAQKPKWVNDPYTTTIGHEIMHCVWGGYHPTKQQ